MRIYLHPTIYLGLIQCHSDIHGVTPAFVVTILRLAALLIEPITRFHAFILSSRRQYYQLLPAFLN